jgi:hypothetical protein
MRMADVRKWALGALLVGVAVTAAEAGPILLPSGDRGAAAAVSDDSKLAFLFHHRYDDVRIPEAWSRVSPTPGAFTLPRETRPAPPFVDVPPGLAIAPGPGGVTRGPHELGPPGQDRPTAAVPEPATLLLLGVGALGAAFALRRGTIDVR